MIVWYYLIFVAAVFTTISTLIEKGTLAREHASAYIASFCLVGALFSLLLLPYATWNISLYAIGLIFVTALLNSVVNLLAARVYKHSNITVSSPVLSSLPQFFVVILALIFLGEQLRPIQYISIAVMLIAVYLIMFKSSPKHKYPFERSIYVYFLLGTAVISAVTTILLKYVITTVNPITFLILLQVFMAIDMMVYMQFHYGGVKEIARNTRKFSIPIVATAAFTTAYRYFYYTAIVSTSIALASPLLNTFAVLMTVLMGVIIFKEGNLKKKLLLSAIMIIAVFFLVI